MSPSALKTIFFLVIGAYLSILCVYYYGSPVSLRQAGESFRTSATTLISDDLEDKREAYTQSQFVQSQEVDASFNEELELKNDLLKEVESEVERQRMIIEENEKRIKNLERQLARSEHNVAQFKQAKDTIADQALQIKDNLKKSFTKYQAKNTTLAYMSDVIAEINPFRKLGLYSTMPEEYYNHKPAANFINGQQYYAIKHNPAYCDAVDLYNLRNPSNLFNQMNFIADYVFDEKLVRENVMKKIGNDVMPGITMAEREHQTPKYDLAVNGTMYFFKRVHMHSFYQMNQEWACNSQMYNHIPGNGVLTRKDLLVQTINTYTQAYADRPQCIQEDKFFPLALRLDLESECKRFFRLINSPSFHKNKEHEPIQYLIKTGYGAHRASGVFLIVDAYEAEVREWYKNGALCGTVKKPLVAQKYVSNPLLLDKKNKFDFRMYMLVASVDPLIVYYHDGFLRVSLSEYDKFSKEKNVHFTNTHLSKEVFKKAHEENSFEGMTEEQLRDYQMWTMEELESYLLQTGKIQDKNWLENYLRPKFKEAFVHISRMAESSFYKSPSVFEMYGIDFVIDEDLDIWLIEVNASPQLVGTSEKKTKFLTKMLTDLFEIEYSYLRSRMQRTHKFVNEMEKRAQNGENLDYGKLRREFSELNTNRLEPEFEISKENTFVKILDHNIQGPAAYFGHIHEQCNN